MDALRETVDEMQHAERPLLIKRSAQTTQMYYTTLASLLLGTLLGLSAIMAFVWLLRRHWHAAHQPRPICGTSASTSAPRFPASATP